MYERITVDLAVSNSNVSNNLMNNSFKCYLFQKTDRHTQQINIHTNFCSEQNICTDSVCLQVYSNLYIFKLTSIIKILYHLTLAIIYFKSQMIIY